MSIWPLAVLLVCFGACGGNEQEVHFSITSDGLTRNGRLLKDSARGTVIAFEFLDNQSIDILVSKEPGGSNRLLAGLLGNVHIPEGAPGTVRLQLSTSSGEHIEIPWDVLWVYIDANDQALVSLGGVPLTPVPNLNEVVNFIKAVAMSDDSAELPPILIATDSASTSQLQKTIEIVKGATGGNIYRLTDHIEVVR